MSGIILYSSDSHTFIAFKHVFLVYSSIYVYINIHSFTVTNICRRLPCSETTLEQLCALGLQAELGDFDPSRVGEDYIHQFRFIQERNVQFFMNVSHIHSEKKGFPPAQAELLFLSIASSKPKF